MRRAGYQSVWSPACQDQVAGGHAGVGVASLGDAPLSLPSFVAPEFQWFFTLGGVFENHSSYWERSGSSLCGPWVSGARRILFSFNLLTSFCRQSYAGWFVDLALAYSLGAGRKLDATCKFRREDCVGSRKDFIVSCPHAVAASTACFVTDRWFTPHFSVFSCFSIDGWSADIACPEVCQPVWPARWIGTTEKSSSSVTRVVQDAWDVYRDEVAAVQPDVVLALRDAVSRSCVDDFWTIWTKSAEAGLLVRTVGLVVPLRLAALPLLEEVCFVSVVDVLGQNCWAQWC